MSADIQNAETTYRPTPPAYLAQNVRNTGHALGFRQHWPNKVDLSCVNLQRKISKAELQKHKAEVRRRRCSQKTYDRPRRQSLPTTLGEYVRLVDPFLSRNKAIASDEVEDLEDALSKVFRPESYRYLRGRGYDVEDVVAWAWILTSKHPHQAISRIFTLEAERQFKGNDTVTELPLFIPLFLLNEPHLDARSFRLLLIYCLHLMSGQPLSSLAAQESVLEPSNWTSAQLNPHVNLDPKTCMIMVVRLIRHARLVSPQSFPNIASAFSRFFTSSITLHTKLAVNFNACLCLLSLPTKLHPYRSTYFQEQAQFELLRAMASHDPVLPLTRRSYRAVIAVQVAHKKTLAERQSAELKAPSWPPWKEERLGIDADRGNEGMYSRAKSVLTQMKEAGYAHQTWEQIASILAGWDTDHSPTVQTRKMLPRPRDSLSTSDNDPDHYAIWAARIRATRTVREAWACFLSYQDKGLKRKRAIYFAMAERLIYRGKAVEAEFDQSSHALPGDGLEVYPEPASARDIIYVHTEPPTWEEFVDHMISQGIRPSGRFLALLLHSAPSFGSGLRYLRASDLTEDQITALCTVWYQPSKGGNTTWTNGNARYLEALRALPDYVFASFINFLCPHWNIDFSQVWGDTNSFQTYHFPMLLATKPRKTPVVDLSKLEEQAGQKFHPKSKSLWHGVQLAKLRQPICHEAWSHILIALSQKGRGDRRTSSTRLRGLYHILAWQETVEVIKWMKSHSIEPGSKGFYALCTAFHRAVTAATRHIGLVENASRLIHEVNHPHTPIEPNNLDTFDDLVETGLQLLKSEFDNLVLPDLVIPNLVIPASMTSELAEQSVFTVDGTSNGTAIKMPSVLHVPSYATLHRFVRVLGLVGDDAGLLNLLRWMSQSAGQLNELADEEMNGNKMMRQTLVAIRVYLEKIEKKGRGLESTRRATDPQVREARDIISRIPEWEWPSDAEVEEYLR